MNQENDNGFFNAVIKLFSRALREPIKELEKEEKGKDYIERVEVEIDRLFKTTYLNQAARTQEKRKLLLKYPELSGIRPEEIQPGEKLNNRLYRRGQTKSQL